MSIPVVLDHTRHRKLSEMVEQMVTTGEAVLPAESLAAVKAEVRADADLLQTAFKTTMVVMQREHAQIRLGCLKLYTYLFMRSALFREYAVPEFHTMVELCIGLDDVEQPLPPPKRFARELRTDALRFVQSAHHKYGQNYKQIDLAYNFLRRRHRVDFDATQAASRAEQQAAVQRAAAAERQQAANCSKVQTEMDRWLPEIELLLAELEAAFPLAVPDITAPEPAPPLNLNQAASATSSPPSSPGEAEAAESPDDGQVAIDALQRLAPVIAPAAVPPVAHMTSDSAPDAADALAFTTSDATDSQPTGRVASSGSGNTLLPHRDVVAHHRHLHVPGDAIHLAVAPSRGVDVDAKDNEALLSVIHEGNGLLTKTFVPKVTGWIGRIQGSSAPDAAALLPRLIDLRARLHAAQGKCREVKAVQGGPGNEHGSSTASRGRHAMVKGSHDTSAEADDGSDDETEDDEEEEDELLVDVGEFEYQHLGPAAPHRPSSAGAAAASGSGQHGAETGSRGSSATAAADATGTRAAAAAAATDSTHGGRSARAAGKQQRQSLPDPKQSRKRKKPPSALVDLNSPTTKARQRLKRMIKRPPRSIVPKRA
eukprot:m.27635 g.27635  ORF g.27635 m.27635 type:complete len:597 (+) comp4431_c0_seq2:330-2120(+)